MVENVFHILLADAHACSRIGLCQILTGAGFSIVAETGYLNKLDALIQAHHPHILLLASNLLPASPIPFLVNLQQKHSEITVVLLIDNDNGLPLRALVNAGASGILLKTESCDIISQVVKVAATGGAAFSPELLDRITRLSHMSMTGTENMSLTTQEQQLLQFLCADKSNPEIAQSLDLSRKTIEKRLTALYKKLGVRTRTGAAILYLKLDK